ncbi:hypothetical protein SPRG_10035 [Saprolegnia parasitica CBS 223.65]|uniref:PX domain-containing protein n=1 Tax=Saprolegnia parasitica (strain CBS 223.65) TaxID=695850 RepID=A0A067C422_SAPPC|nr:hypothetical protein SPRG_10035 [Saprolegnia parasitica CBS 223.65]KDO23890.1 hypothetical protein SPRG_10035 [Saprolegnia parasitica CBS 223.65]|eukprot:XP_012205360.1 hypothetical protein SPRG_10035 [Saprolegnia parasitica CBS 223.65]
MGCTQSADIVEVSAPTFMDECTASAPASKSLKYSPPTSSGSKSASVVLEPIVVPPPVYVIEEETVFENGAVHYVILGPNELFLKKRYNDFKLLHTTLAEDGAELPDMPDVTLWSALSRHNGQLISDRRERFQAILDAVAAKHHESRAMATFAA